MKTPPARGLTALRELLAHELARATGRHADPETEILVTNGAMQALGVCFRSLLAAGDEVIVPTPCFFFAGPIVAAGGIPVYVPGSADDGWRWDHDAIERAIGKRTRALLLCNPGNPTGYVPSRDDVRRAVEIAERHGLLVVTDEAYEASLWEDAELTSAFGLGENVVVIRSLGKSLSLPQLRIGFLAGPPRRRRGVRTHARVGLPACRCRGSGGGTSPSSKDRETGSRRPPPALRPIGRSPSPRSGDVRARRRRSARSTVPVRRVALRSGTPLAASRRSASRSSTEPRFGLPATRACRSEAQQPQRQP